MSFNNHGDGNDEKYGGSSSSSNNKTIYNKPTGIDNRR